MKIEKISRRNRNSWNNNFAVFLFCAVAAIASSAQTVTAVAAFNGANGQEPNSLVQGSDGNFYGTTPSGGADRQGTVFQVTPAGSITSLYSFCSQLPDCADGGVPDGPLVPVADGSLYGTTAVGGAANAGTIFTITPAGQLATIYTFALTDGALPQGLVPAIDGNFYGVASQGGANCGDPGCGTLFKVTPTGTLTVLYNFCSRANCSDGSSPAAVMRAANGNFYGATRMNGLDDSTCGTIFEVTPAGRLTTLHTFKHSDGCGPSGVIQGSDKNFYGTTLYGGAHGAGTFFKINAAGTLEAFYSFCSQANCADGNAPTGLLLQASDGNLYGTTVLGGNGARNAGTIFQVTPSGKLNTIYSFCAQKSCSEGGKPTGSLIQATDGNIYGVASQGPVGNGAGAGAGTVFRLTIGGATVR
jgi:uncharacterized repeat protein (TIGR03803 family)